MILNFTIFFLSFFGRLEQQYYLNESMLMFITCICRNSLLQKLLSDLFNRSLVWLPYQEIYQWKLRIQPVHHVASHFSYYSKNFQSQSFGASKSQYWSWYHRCWCLLCCWNHPKSVFPISLEGILKETKYNCGMKGAATVLRVCHWGVDWLQMFLLK